MADEENQGFSLADLADINVDDIAEIRFENLPAGIYDFICRDPQLNEGSKDDEKIFYFDAKCEIEEVVTVLDSGVDQAALVGKIQNFRQNIEPADAEKGIGRVRAFATDIGQDSTGKLGDVVARCKDVRFRAKIVHTKDKTDPSVVYANLRFDAKK